MRQSMSMLGTGFLQLLKSENDLSFIFNQNEARRNSFLKFYLNYISFLLGVPFILGAATTSAAGSKLRCGAGAMGQCPGCPRHTLPDSSAPQRCAGPRKHVHTSAKNSGLDFSVSLMEN